MNTSDMQHVSLNVFSLRRAKASWREGWFQISGSKCARCTWDSYHAWKLDRGRNRAWEAQSPTQCHTGARALGITRVPGPSPCRRQSPLRQASRPQPSQLMFQPESELSDHGSSLPHLGDFDNKSILSHFGIGELLTLASCTIEASQIWNAHAYVLGRLHP